ncbi:MAG: hypothetical protein CL675_11335 [Bdellovibrionaceae bacterium]|nr:hypothetical protein [Pseudobdellovibrionaceae bacterium]
MAHDSNHQGLTSRPSQGPSGSKIKCGELQFGIGVRVDGYHLTTGITTDRKVRIGGLVKDPITTVTNVDCDIGCPTADIVTDNLVWRVKTPQGRVPH